MGIIEKIKSWFGTLLMSKAAEDFSTSFLNTQSMDALIQRCTEIYRGNPDWVDDGIKTINFARSLCTEIARLTTLGIGINISGSTRAKWLQKQIDNCYFSLRAWVEYGNAQGMIILKPNGKNVDFVPYGKFKITQLRGGEIVGAVFTDSIYSAEKKKWFTRLEYHHFKDYEVYEVENKVYVADHEGEAGKRISIEESPWIGVEEHVAIKGLEHPLFGVYKTPGANNLQFNSPVGLPIFSDVLEELRDLDVAYSRNAEEIEESRKIVLLDADRLFTGNQLIESGAQYEEQRDVLKLPHYVKGVPAGVNGDGNFYREIVPSLNTEIREAGMNALLSKIGYKVGFANGYFVFNQQSGIATATQIEADQQRTIQLVKDFRDRLEHCMNGVIYALNVFADLYDLAPSGKYEVVYDFGDITYNREEDRARWYSYVVAGKVPFWFYLKKFEGFSEEDAKALEASAAPHETVFPEAE